MADVFDAPARSVSIADKHACAARELQLRREVYRRLVSEGRMKREDAEREFARMAAIEDDYARLLAFQGSVIEATLVRIRFRFDDRVRLTFDTRVEIAGQDVPRTVEASMRADPYNLAALVREASAILPELNADGRRRRPGDPMTDWANTVPRKDAAE